MSSKVQLTIPNKGGTVTVNGTMKLVSGERMQLSFLMPILRSEIARLEITPNDVLVVDRMGKRYVQATRKELKDILPRKADFAYLEKILFDAAKPGGKATFCLLYTSGVCGEQEYYPVGTLHYQPVILCYNGSAFCNRFDAESKFHSVIVQDSGIDVYKRQGIYYAVHLFQVISAFGALKSGFLWQIKMIKIICLVYDCLLYTSNTDYEVAYDQFVLSGNKNYRTPETKLSGKVEMNIDPATGALRSYIYNRKELLFSPVTLSLYRPVTDNDNREKVGGAKAWKKAGLDQLTQRALTVKTSTRGGRAEVELLNVRGEKVGTASFVYTLKKNGELDIQTHFCLLYTSPESVFSDNVKGRGYLGNTLGSHFGVANIFLEGKAPGLFYGYQTDGIVQESDLTDGSYKITKDINGGVPQAGDIKFIDQNGDGEINEADKMILGDPNRPMTYGFQTKLTYKGLSLSAAFTGVSGYDVLNTNVRYEQTPSRQTSNLYPVSYTHL